MHSGNQQVEHFSMTSIQISHTHMRQTTKNLLLVPLKTNGSFFTKTNQNHNGVLSNLPKMELAENIHKSI